MWRRACLVLATLMTFAGEAWALTPTMTPNAPPLIVGNSPTPTPPPATLTPTRTGTRTATRTSTPVPTAPFTQAPAGTVTQTPTVGAFTLRFLSHRAWRLHFSLLP